LLPKPAPFFVCDLQQFSGFQMEQSDDPSVFHGRTSATKKPERWLAVAIAASNRELIKAVVAEMSQGIDCALGFWMEQIENALGDPHLTTLGRLNAVRGIVQHYRNRATETGVAVDGYVA
jgi:hypothetical protein